VLSLGIMTRSALCVVNFWTLVLTSNELTFSSEM